ncbi:UNVERIFIED_CONTAM: hypothetical protein H355_011326 [Colinus virginianus]|nr:hypothetical protein H355_011326 [Colinus virginianus]
MAADSAEQFCVAEERSGHCAVVDGNFLYVWGGYVSIEENEVYLPNDELWIYEMDSGLWTMHLMEGELPTSMSGSCGASINGKLYIFGGFDDKGYSNRVLLIYFGGYGCRKHNELSDCFDVHDAFWEGQIFWGWHNDVHVFDTNTQTWSQPTIRFTIIQIFPGKRLCKEPERARKCHEASPIHPSGRRGHLFPKLELELVKEDGDDQNQLYQESFENRLRSVMWTLFLQQTRMNDLHCLNLDTWTWSGRLWHTACLGKEGEVMVFGGSKDDLHFMDTGHCSDLLIFQTQPYSLLRLCLDCIGKNAALLQNQIPCLPSKLLQQVLKKITFWAAVSHRQEKKAETERQCQLNTT